MDPRGRHRSAWIVAQTLHRICKCLPGGVLDFRSAHSQVTVHGSLDMLVTSGAIYGVHMDLSNTDAVVLEIQPFFPLRRDRVEIPWTVTLDMLEEMFPELVVLEVIGS